MTCTRCFNAIYFPFQVCNHPDLFESRPTVSPFIMDSGISYKAPSIALKLMEYDPLKQVDLSSLNLCFADSELTIPAFASHRTQELKVKRRLIEEIDCFDFETEKKADFGPPSNIFDILNPGESKMNFDNSNSCDGNEIDVVGDVDIDELMPDDSKKHEGLLLDDYVANENTPLSMVCIYFGTLICFDQSVELSIDHFSHWCSQSMI